MEEIAKHITVYISHAFEIASAVVIAAGLFKLIFTNLRAVSGKQVRVSFIDAEMTYSPTYRA
jgi:hypothetical protein